MYSDISLTCTEGRAGVDNAVFVYLLSNCVFCFVGLSVCFFFCSFSMPCIAQFLFACWLVYFS